MREEILKKQAGMHVMRLIAFSNNLTITNNIARQIDDLVDSDSLKPVSYEDKIRIVEYMRETEIVVHAAENRVLNKLIDEIKRLIKR